MIEVTVYKSNNGRTYDTKEEAEFADKVNAILSAIAYTSLPTNMLQRDKTAFVEALMEKFDITPKAK